MMAGMGMMGGKQAKSKKFTAADPNNQTNPSN